MKRLTFIIIFVIQLLNVMAYDFEVDGIYYNIISEKTKTVEVTYKENLAFELNRYFSSKLKTLKDMGIKSILLDPGFGFGKSIASQYDLINRLSLLVQQQFPLLVGISRKSFIYKPLGKNPKEVDDRTQELHYQVLQQGAKILRVHDVASTRQTIERFMSEAKAKI